MLMADASLAVFIKRLEQGLITPEEFMRYANTVPSADSIRLGYENASREYRKLVESTLGAKDQQRVDDFIKENPLKGWTIPAFPFFIKSKPVVYVTIGTREFIAAKVYDFCELFDDHDEWAEIIVYESSLVTELMKLGLVGQHMKGSYFPTATFKEFSQNFKEEFHKFRAANPCVL